MVNLHSPDAGICKLPSETASHIAAYCRQDDFPALLSSSKRLNALFTPAVYSDIDVTNSSATNLLLTLTGAFRPTTHSYHLFVRRLQLNWSEQYFQPELAFNLMQSLALTVNLRHLALLVEPTALTTMLRYAYKSRIIALTNQRHTMTTLPVLNSFSVHETPQLFVLADKRNVEHITLTQYLLPATLTSSINYMRYASSNLHSINLRLHERTTLSDFFQAITDSCTKLRVIRVSRGRSSSVNALLLLIKFAGSLSDLETFSLNGRCTSSPCYLDDEGTILKAHQKHLQKISTVLTNIRSIRFGPLRWYRQRLGWYCFKGEIIRHLLYDHAAKYRRYMGIDLNAATISLILGSLSVPRAFVGDMK